MANVKLLFSGTKETKTEDHTLELFHSSHNEIFIEIVMCEGRWAYLSLDKSTAIKLHRELKKQISFISENEI